MKVLFLIRSLDLGGAERQMTLLAQGLQARAHEVGVACFYASGPLLVTLQKAGVPMHDLKKGGRWDLPGFAGRLRGLVDEFKPQVIYSFLDTPNLAAAWLLKGRAGAKLVWGVRASDMEQGDYGWFPGLMQRLVRLSAQRADLIIANSRAGADHLGSDKIAVIPNGIDREGFVPDPDAGEALRGEWGVAPDAPLVGLVGRLDPMKDIPNFLRTGALLREQLPGLRLVVVGGGPVEYQQELAALAKELGLSDALIWAGQREDMPAVMNALDLLILSSAFGEGFPNVVGEAMATATPCVVTEVGDAARLVHDPALVAPKKDPAALAERALAVLTLSPEERARLGARLRQRVEEEFSLEAMVTASEAELMRLAGESGHVS